MSLRQFILILFAVIFSCGVLHAQEENGEVAQYATRYVDLRIKSLEKYNGHIKRQQKLLLKRLKRKEEKFANRLRKRDSLGYESFKNDNVTYDSIATFAANDSCGTSMSPKQNKTVDSLKAISSYVSVADSLDAVKRLGPLQKELGKDQQVNTLIKQHTARLKSLSKEGGFQSIEKDVFYCNARMGVFKKMEQDPTVAEDKALDYLKGVEGFNEKMQSAGGLADGMGNSQNAQQMVGLQTKKIVEQSFKTSFGNSSIPAISKAKEQLGDWQRQQQKISDYKSSAAINRTNINGPSFQVNPMRGLPFRKRIEKQYSWQFTRASQDGSQPALIQGSYSLGFKHTPHLTYGAGVLANIGLGYNWDNLKLSLQGIGWKTYAQWALPFGFNLYGGYECVYKCGMFSKNEPTNNDFIPQAHNNNTYSESLLLGVTKEYQISKKLTGAVQVLYDVWWQQKSLNSPIVIRVTSKK